jgi:DNA-binding CsgD family transcriptional regulator/PAS domain-containing protein
MSEDELLDLIYGAAVDPRGWTDVLERLVARLDGTNGWLSQLSMVDGSGGTFDDPTTRCDPYWKEQYIEHFATRNPLSNVERPFEYLQSWTHRVLVDEDWVPKDELLRTEYYNDFMSPQDVHSAMMIRLAKRGVDVATLNISRSASRGRFEDAELAFARRMHPHLIRAFELSSKIAPLRKLEGELTALIDLSPHGLFVLDQTGRLRHLNRVAERLLAEEGGLRLFGGRLSASDPVTARRLLALIEAAGSTDVELRRAGAMALPTASRRLPLSISVTPFPSEVGLHPRGGRGVVVCVTDLEAGVQLPEQGMKDLFGMTAAEARLAIAILEGCSLREAGDRFAVSQNTLHVQLASIFQKTGVNRQSELVRLLMRAAHNEG